MSEQRPWVVRMMDFGKYMRSRGHRCTFIHSGQTVRPIGIKYSGYRRRYMNDNYRPRKKP